MSLDSIDTAAFAALNALAASASPAGHFAHVGRYIGQVTVQGGKVSLTREALARVPAVLWQWEGERASNDFEAQEGDRESVGVVLFSAWVVVGDARSTELLVKGGTGTPGPTTLHDQVLSALNGLQVAGMLRHHRLDWVGTRNYATGTAHVSELRFEARRSAPTVTEATQGVALSRLDGSINLDPNPGNNPLTQFRSTP